jgi:hypothetical protein
VLRKLSLQHFVHHGDVDFQPVSALSMRLFPCLLLGHAGGRQPPNMLREGRICVHELERLEDCERTA